MSAPRSLVVLLVGKPDPWMTSLRDALRLHLPTRGWGCLRLTAADGLAGWRALRDGLAVTESDRVLLTAEQLPFCHIDALHELHEVLAARFRDVRVIGYVRPPREAMECALQELLAEHASAVPRELAALYPRYHQSFAALDLVFGAERVRLARLNPPALRRGDILQDAGNRFGLEVSAEARVRPAPFYLSMVAAGWLYAFRCHFAEVAASDAVSVDRRLMQVLGRVRGMPLRFAPDVLRPLFIAEQDDISWMELRLDYPLAENMVDDPAHLHSIDALGDTVSSSLPLLQRLAGCESLPSPGAVRTCAALMVDTLRRQLASPSALCSGRDAMLGELLQQAVERGPVALAGVPPAQGIALLRSVLSVLAGELAEAGEVPLTVPCLGRFRRAAGAGGIRFLPKPGAGQ